MYSNSKIKEIVEATALDQFPDIDISINCKKS